MTRRSAVARVGVVLAARALPTPGQQRRYRAEFLAELHDLTPARQVRHTAGVVARTPALRAAPREASMNSSTSPGSFWRCRVFHLHDWVTRANPDGGRYQTCVRCGEDRGPIANLATTTPPWPHYPR